MSGEIKFQGELFAVRLRERGSNDKHISVALLTNDDGNEYEVDSFSSYWVDDMIKVLQAARKHLKAQEPDIDPISGKQWGWKFR